MKASYWYTSGRKTSDWKVGDVLGQGAGGGRIYYYRLLRIDEVRTKRDKPSVLFTWRGACAVCDAEFDQDTNPGLTHMLRRCEKHQTRCVA